MLLTLRLVFFGLFAFFVLCVLLVHLRGRIRLRFDRQLADHSALFAPYNLLMYAFSRVPAKPILDRAGFPHLDPLRAHWQTIRAEAVQLFDEGHIRAAEQRNDLSFDSFFKQGWKRFYLKWYGEPLATAQALCPQTVALLREIPQVKAAMFALLPPGSRLTPHRDPFAGSLRYHLGLVTPNANSCRIFVDGEEYAWSDGGDIVFDETFVHWAENNSEVTRVILFADVERPLRARWMEAINRRVGAFMGAITASPNDTATEKTGFVNRLYARLRGQNKRGVTFRKRHPRLYRVIKYPAILLALWLLFAAPWPLL